MGFPSSTDWWSKDTIAVVTGGNKGIGYEIIRQLAAKGVTVVLTARDESRGQAAVNALKAEGLGNVWFHQLDVDSPESVQTLATWLASKFGGIDILVNNAGLNAGPNGTHLDYENAKAIIATNYYGVKNVTEGLLPLLRASPARARIVNASSRRGLYNRFRSQALKDVFKNEDGYTKELIDSLAVKYLQDVKEGRTDEEGWVEGTPSTAPMYSESKVFLSAYATILAKSCLKLQPEDRQILVSTFCPGATDTDMLAGAIEKGLQTLKVFVVKTVPEGADTAVWLALLPKEELAPKTGKFFGERQEYPFGWENPPF